MVHYSGLFSLEKHEKIWKNQFFRASMADWRNTAQVALAGLRSMGLKAYDFGKLNDEP